METISVGSVNHRKTPPSDKVVTADYLYSYILELNKRSKTEKIETSRTEIVSAIVSHNGTCIVKDHRVRGMALALRFLNTIVSSARIVGDQRDLAVLPLFTTEFIRQTHQILTTPEYMANKEMCRRHKVLPGSLVIAQNDLDRWCGELGKRKFNILLTNTGLTTIVCDSLTKLYHKRPFTTANASLINLLWWYANKRAGKMLHPGQTLILPMENKGQ